MHRARAAPGRRRFLRVTTSCCVQSDARLAMSRFASALGGPDDLPEYKGHFSPEALHKMCTYSTQMESYMSRC